MVKFQSSHVDTIKSWLRSHQLDELLVAEYCVGSFVSMHGKDLIAAASLRFIGSTAILMDLITNPEASSELRHHSIDALTVKIIDEAKSFGASELLAWTKDEDVLKRSFGHGFKVIPQTMIGLDLKGE